jgi:hypothetical protein
VTARRRDLVALTTVGLLLLTGCGGGHHSPPSPAWHESSLPTPAGSRAIVRDAAYCGGRWYVVGATATSPTRTRPAVWSSTDAEHWRAVRLDAGGDYYAARAILGSVGCSRGRIAVLGAKSGGAHGMPRTATWRQRGDRSLVAVRASYELYGGVRAVRVNRLSGSAQGWLIAGTRTSGAAVWRSDDARRFRIEEGAPGLADTRRATTQGFDAAWHDGAWWVVGTAVDRGGVETAMAWTPADGDRWTPRPLPVEASLATGERLTGTPRGLVAVGLDDDAFAAWTLTDGSWTLTRAFGHRDPAGTEAAYVAGLASVGGEVAVTYSDGAHFRLALGPAGGPYPDVAPPVSVPVTGDDQLAVAGGDGRFLLLADEGSGGRVWVADGPSG